MFQANAHASDAAREDCERKHERSLRAESVASPAAHRDKHGQAHEVARHHPFDGRRFGRKFTLQRGNGDVDDRHVEVLHEEPERRDDRHDPLVFKTLCHAWFPGVL